MKNQLITKKEFRKLSRTSTFFIGWYYKFSTQSNYTGIVIGGFIKKRNAETIGFIQVFDNQDSPPSYKDYPYDQCKIDHTNQEITIGPNQLSLKKLDVSLNSFSIELVIEKNTPYKHKGIGKNILGPLHYVPFVECKHSIINIQSNFKGIICKEEQTSEASGICYQEKNWGRSFPQNYFWIHSDKFTTEEISFQFAYAKPKWLIFKPTVYIGFIAIDNKIINLNGFGNKNIQINELTEKNIELTLKQKNYRITVMLSSGPTKKLKGPVNGKMEKTIRESLNSKLKITIHERKKPLKPIIYTSNSASSEIYLNKMNFK